VILPHLLGKEIRAIISITKGFFDQAAEHFRKKYFRVMSGTEAEL
jgi:hypothetical protein